MVFCELMILYPVLKLKFKSHLKILIDEFLYMNIFYILKCNEIQTNNSSVNIFLHACKHQAGSVFGGV